MSRKRLTYIPVLAGALMLLVSAPGARADSGFVAPLGEIPLTNPLVTGARAAGMRPPSHLIPRQWPGCTEWSCPAVSGEACSRSKVKWQAARLPPT